jgi:cyclic-di-GMP-binding biofilm dispersal mediator protein
METRDLSSTSVLVLGGSGSLGLRIASDLADRGALITLAGRDPAMLAAAAETVPGSATSVFDLRTADQAGWPIEASISAHGRIDGVVNAAGSVAFGPLADTPNAVIDEIIEVNLTGPLRVFREALRTMEGGFIVTITGVVATMPTAGMVAYSAAKAGLAAGVAALTREVRRSGVTVIDAQPPHTETGLASRALIGHAPHLPQGLDPDFVARRIVKGIVEGERVIPADAFVEL